MAKLSGGTSTASASGGGGGSDATGAGGASVAIPCARHARSTLRRTRGHGVDDSEPTRVVAVKVPKAVRRSDGAEDGVLKAAEGGEVARRRWRGGWRR